MNFAMLTKANPNSPLPTMILFGSMAALFYFLLIRPQNKARKQMEERLAKLKAGDEVMISGGLFATIDRVEDKNIYLKLGNNVVKAKRNAVIALIDDQVAE
jgi:preprotein translocase subunit YajC